MNGTARVSHGLQLDATSFVLGVRRMVCPPVRPLRCAAPHAKLLFVKMLAPRSSDEEVGTRRGGGHDAERPPALHAVIKEEKKPLPQALAFPSVWVTALST